MSFGDIIDSLGNAAAGVSNAQAQSTFQSEGFIVSETPSADGTGLPSSKVRSGRFPAKEKRRLIHWFVPEFGVVKMYINPQSIQYSFKKIISKTLTKGGYAVQYWGEDLTTLNISGTTGSSGVEGLNVLDEIYRGEQLAFDAYGLTLASNSQASGAAGLLDSAANSLLGSGVGGLVGDALGGLTGADPAAANFLPQNIPSLASLAMGVEMYWDGWVFRGFFEAFSFTESIQHTGEFDYQMTFTVTQRRGYRTNFMPWHRSAIDGGSNNSVGGIPATFRR